jgi:ribonuclease HI
LRLKTLEKFISKLKRLNTECTVFQAELCGIGMAVDWIQNQRKGTSYYAINVDSKAALLAIANKHSTHHLAEDTRRKIIKLRTTTKITFHWIKGHTGLKGNERADYLAKTVASYNPNITYGTIPVSRGKQLLEDYYTQIWDATYINSRKAAHTKPFIPSIFHRKSLSLWPNHILTQLLSNHGCFRSHLHKMKKSPTPLCSCPEKVEQTARYLMIECSLFSKDRPAALQNLPLPMITQFHIHTVNVHRLIKNIF